MPRPPPSPPLANSSDLLGAPLLIEPTTAAEPLTSSSSPEAAAGCCSSLFLAWLWPLLRTGRRRKLNQADMYALMPSERARPVADHFQRQWEQLAHEHVGRPGRRMVAVVWRLEGRTYFAMFLLKVFGDLVQFVTPLALQQIILWIQDSNTAAPAWAAFVPPAHRGLYYCGLMTAATLVQCWCFVTSCLKGFKVGVHVRTAATVALYRKALRQAACARAEVSIGKITNLMASDATRLMRCIPYLHWLVAGLVQVSIATSLLWALIGPSVLVGLVVTLTLSPIGALCARKVNQHNRSVLARRDKRVSHENELISAIKLIKSNGWEDCFTKRIHAARETELTALYWYYLFMMLGGIIWEAGVPFTVATTLSIFSLQGGTVTPSLAFTALALFDIMAAPCQDMAFVFSQFVMALTSFHRVGSYLETKELSQEALRRRSKADLEGQDYISIKFCGACFHWGSAPVPDESQPEIQQVLRTLDTAVEAGALSDKRAGIAKAAVVNSVLPGIKEKSSFRLRNIVLEIPFGSLIAVVGAVGSGKSALLSAVLGEMEIDNNGCPAVQVCGNVAFAAQSPYIVSATLKNNILFGLPFDAAKYAKTIASCCLGPDLAILSGGDNVEIGEDGINLSGGQRSRLSLARAVYASLMGAADILLLDDVLSAVDAHVGAAIMEQCILQMFRRKKTVVLVTHAIHYCSSCDRIIVMQDGGIVENGSYSELVASGGQFTALVQTYQDEVQLQQRQEGTSEVARAKVSAPSSSTPPPPPSPSSPPPSSPPPMNRAAKTSTNELSSDGGSGGGSGGERLTEDETRETGRVDFSLYAGYVRAAGLPRMLLVLSLFAVVPAVGILLSYWLVIWTEGRMKGWSQLQYVRVYAAISGTSVLIVAFRQGLRASVAVQAARTLHQGLLSAVAAVRLSFFQTTPTGRLMNRFSNDTTTIDEEFFTEFCGSFKQAFRVLATLIVVTWADPLFLFFVLPIGAFYYRINWWYIGSNREVNRLDSISRSPVYAHFQETLNGVSTIRAYGASERFLTEHIQRLDENTRPLVLSFALTAWLRLHCEGVVAGSIVLTTAALAVSSESSNPGQTGMALQYCMQIIGCLSVFVIQLTSMEARAVSLERIKGYSQLPEEGKIDDQHDVLSPPPTILERWPSSGRVEWRGAGLAYRHGLPLALRDLNFTIQSGERVGVCGRTGAGKSSLSVALLRLADVTTGQIMIDGLDTTTVPLAVLRSRLALISQEATLFAGDLRTNLDPRGEHSDDTLLTALNRVGLSDLVEGGGGLRTEVAENGGNLSRGQQQLVAIARALLKNARIVLLDEATASCDVTTDAMVQTVIRDVFQGCTVITIAHRMHTIADADKILVLSEGSVVEFETPEVLMAQPSSAYRALVEESQGKHATTSGDSIALPGLE